VYIGTVCHRYVALPGSKPGKFTYLGKVNNPHSQRNKHSGASNDEEQMGISRSKMGHEHRRHM